jgi:enterochelin esterase-like enzyme
VAFAGCGGSSTVRTVTTPGLPPPEAFARLEPAAPTGSGAALERTYVQRCAASLERPPRWHARRPGSVTVARLRSPDSSQRMREVWIYRPGGLPDDARLPVVYVLHGYPGRASGLWTRADTARGFDELFASGARPFVVVTMDGEGATHRDSEWADSLDGADRVESFLLTRVIPAVEGTHRRDACHRAVVGFSMGGYGAVNLAQRHPDVFGQAVSVAGYFHVDDPSHVFAGDAAAERANSPDLQVARMRGLRLFLLDAGQENFALVQGEAARFARLLIGAKIPVVLEYAPGEHTTQYAFAQLPAVTTFLEAGWVPRPF